MISYLEEQSGKSLQIIIKQVLGEAKMQIGQKLHNTWDYTESSEFVSTVALCFQEETCSPKLRPAYQTTLYINTYNLSIPRLIA